VAVSLEDWAKLDRAISEMAAGSADVREDGQWFAELSSLKHEIRQQGKDCLLHLSSAERHLTRRILGIKESSAERIVLDVQRFGRPKPGRLEIVRTDAPKTPARVSREDFRERLRRILVHEFPDAVTEKLTSAPDLEHSLSGVYVRGRMRDAGREWALVAVPPWESSATVDRILAFGILWLDLLRSQTTKHPVEGLRLVVPEGSSKHLCQRIAGLSPAITVEIYELREPEGRLQKADASDAGNLVSRILTRQEMESALASGKGAFLQIESMTSGISRDSGALSARPGDFAGELQFCFEGLQFAAWSGGAISFGLAEKKTKLTHATKPALENLLRQLELYRNSLAERQNHYLFRAAPERWLEKIIRSDPSRLDASLDSARLYSQVVAVEAIDRRVVDLLGISKRGRLVVIELKASEDLQLPIQAMDYWLRVRRHQLAGDFKRSDLFPGAEIDPSPPLLWLVAPALQFHSSNGILLRYLSPEIQVTRLGLNENWRRGLKIVFRE
jgi:hypothetical protein